MPPPEWFNHLSTHIIAWTPWAALALTLALAVAMIGRNLLKVQADLSLRLTAMISQVYAVMMLVMVLCCLLSIPFFMSNGMPLRNPQLFFGLVALWILSVGQWFAARRIPSGCVWARNWCIVSWLAYFTALQWPFDTGYWGVPAGLWVLGVWCRTGMKRWRRTILAVAAFAALLIGFRDWYKDFVISTYPFTATLSTAGNGVVARLQKLHVISGTPEVATRQVAEALVRNLNAAGIATELAAPDTVLEIDSNREMVLWLGRGMEPTPPLRYSLALNIPFIGKPAYMLQTLANDHLFIPRNGFSFPGLYVSLGMRIAVSRDAGSQSADMVAQDMTDRLLEILQPLIGASAILIPELPKPESHEVRTAPKLQNFRQLVRGYGSSGVYEVYTFEKNNQDSDVAAVINFLKESGISAQYERPYYGTYSFHNSSSELFYWRERDYTDSNFNLAEIDLSTAVLQIHKELPDDGCDPEFAKRFLAENPVGFLCSDGVRHLEAGQRQDVLKQVLSRSDLSFAIRYIIVRSVIISSLELAAEERALVEENFRMLVREVLATTSFEVYEREISTLYRLSQCEGWQYLTTWLTEQMGDRYVRFEVKGTPNANGILEVEKIFKPASLLDSFCMVEFIFEGFAYQPVTHWIGISPTNDQKWFVREGNTRSTQSAITFPIVFHNVYEIINPHENAPWQMWSIGFGKFDDGKPVVAPERGGMVLTSRMDDKESTITLHIRFAPLLVEEMAWLKRLNGLPSYLDDPEGFEREVLALADELASRKHQNEFPQSAIKLLSVCHALTVRQKVAERLGNSYCRIALAAQPDKDGILKGAVTHPVASLTEAQVICEIDGGAAGEPVVFTCFRIGPESVNGRLLSENSPTSGKLTFFLTPSANPDDVPASTVKLSPAGQLPDVGQFHLVADKKTEACELYFQASFRPQKD